jgi:hypothetical protein
MLLPGAIQVPEYYKKSGEVYSEQLEVTMSTIYGTNKSITQKAEIVLTNPNTNWKTIMNIPSTTLTQFEEFIDASNIEVVDSFFREYSNSRTFKLFVEDILKYFFNRKDKVIEDIREASTEEEYKALYNELQNHNAPNEDIVRIAWDNHRAKEKEEMERIN